MDINRVTGDRCDIAVFARAPVPGEAKTRLIPALGAEGAAALHRRMVRDILAKARAAGLGRVTLWGAPDVSHASFAESATAFGVELRAQGPGDLGARMEAAFHSTLPLLLVGSDCPSIEPSDLRACAAALQSGADAVFLPAEDGGYGLVGLARPQPYLFCDMPWGTADVMALTRTRLRESGLKWAEPRVVWDVDVPSDLERLARLWGCDPMAGRDYFTRPPSW